MSRVDDLIHNYDRFCASALAEEPGTGSTRLDGCLPRLKMNEGSASISPSLRPRPRRPATAGTLIQHRQRVRDLDGQS